MSYKNVKPGENAPEELNVIIEIAQGSNVKYEVDKDLDILIADRFSHGAMYYPFNYGYVPGTLAEDGDPLDVCVIASEPVIPGAVLKSRVIGMLEMEDEAGIDTKIIAVPGKKVDPIYRDIESIDELPEMLRQRIKNFFDRYKDLEEGKWVKTGEFKPKADALEAVKKTLV